VSGFNRLLRPDTLSLNYIKDNMRIILEYFWFFEFDHKVRKSAAFVCMNGLMKNIENVNTLAL